MLNLGENTLKRAKISTKCPFLGLFWVFLACFSGICGPRPVAKGATPVAKELPPEVKGGPYLVVGPPLVAGTLLVVGVPPTSSRYLTTSGTSH